MDILVVIKCFTYNHEPYLRDCLEGFIMQKANFPFVAIVHDDCSTDGTVDILREYAEKYPDIIKPIYETENQYSKHDGSLQKIMDKVVVATGAKYIAICEGDDYWTDPLKLQKQVDFLEEHEEYSLCVNATQWLLNDGSLLRLGCPYTEDSDITTDEIIRGGGLYLNTCSILYRNGHLKKENYKWWKMADIGDYPLYIAASLNGKVRFLADEMSVYRFQCAGSWTSTIGRKENLKHFQIEKTWLEILDNETNGQYREAIYTALFDHMLRPLYQHNRLSTYSYIRAYYYADVEITKKRIVKDILIHYFPIIKHK